MQTTSPNDETNIEDKKVNTTRPKHYTQKRADKFCELIASGKSLRSACKDPTMPSPKTIFSWLRTYSEFNEQYGKATQERAEAMAEYLLDISDDSRNDYIADSYMKGKTPGFQLNQENIQRARLRVDTRKWLMSKTLPRKYGEKLEVESSGEITHKYEELTDEELDRAIKTRQDRLSESN